MYCLPVTDAGMGISQKVLCKMRKCKWVFCITLCEIALSSDLPTDPPQVAQTCV